MSCRRLKEKVAVVTGGAGGIGAATAKRLAAEGATVVIADININGAEAVANEIVASGETAVPFAMDLAKPDDITALFKNVKQQFGRLDILHNNAADTRKEQLERDTTITETDDSVWDTAYTINTKGTVLMLKHGLQLMIDSGGGSIINMKSQASQVGNLFNAAYSATKAAINNITQTVAAQYSQYGIRCNGVVPGMIVTQIFEESMSAEAMAIFEKQILTPYHGRPDDIAATVAFLASDDALFINGQLITVDGGCLAHQPWAADMSALMASMEKGG